jgi:hypothetical protein
MFIDWLEMYQDFEGDIPMLSDQHFLIVDSKTGDCLTTKQPNLIHEGSYCTKILIRISGNRITVSGNPSRFGRLDNLFGFTQLDDCVHVYNRILRDAGLQDFQFTKCTLNGFDNYRQTKEKQKVLKTTNGATITRIDLTSNLSVGADCQDTYIRALSSLRYRNSIPHLYPNGKSVDWKTKKHNAPLIYATAYNKAFEIQLNQLWKIEKQFGKKSEEYKYLCAILHYCESNGVVRLEQKLKSAFLRRKNLNHWGQINESEFTSIHNEFLKLDEKLQVEHMTLEGISEKLLRLDICKTTYSSNITALYAIQWINGKVFDLNLSAVKVHRSRLRKIGIDIANVADLTIHTPVIVRKVQTITPINLTTPDWYIPANKNLTKLKLVA